MRHPPRRRPGPAAATKVFPFRWYGWSNVEVSYDSRLPLAAAAQGGPCAINPVNATLSNPGMKVNKTDYAANGGSGNPFKASGPDLSCLTTYPNCDFGQYDDTWMYTNFTGVVGMRTEIRRITNGEGQKFSLARSIWIPRIITPGPIPPTPAVACKGTTITIFASAPMPRSVAASICRR